MENEREQQVRYIIVKIKCDTGYIRRRDRY